MATPQDLIHSLSRAYALTRERPSGDPELTQALESVREVHGDLGWTVVRVQPHGLAVGTEVVGEEGELVDALSSDLAAAGIRELRFQAPVSMEVLADFLRRVFAAQEPWQGPASTRFRGLERHMGLSFVGTGEALPGMSGAIQGLFAAQKVQGASGPGTDEAPASDAVAVGTPASVAPVGEGGSQREAGSQGAAPAATGLRVDFLELPLGLEDDLRSFAAATGSTRTEAGDRIRDQATQLLATRDVAILGEMVGLLSELAGDSSQPEEVLDLARELSTPAVASHLVARLAGTRNEEEKEHLTQIVGNVGGEVGLALADALGEARDRYQRRTLVDAMVALGPTGQALAEGMLNDSRWYVVRNGVSVLGEVGGEEAVTHLIGTLANPDPRVRKEAVWALAKLGGEDSAMLLLGMLDDGDAEVRSMASRSLGILRIEKAVRPLLRLLESDEEEDVQIECLRALGQIGDPGAVPQIEKRAVGGIFSRPSQEIRIAAYRALSGIGTPHALELLEKAAEDSDSAIRTVVQAILAKRRLLSPADDTGGGSAE